MAATRYICQIRLVPTYIQRAALRNISAQCHKESFKTERLIYKRHMGGQIDGRRDRQTRPGRLPWWWLRIYIYFLEWEVSPEMNYKLIYLPPPYQNYNNLWNIYKIALTDSTKQTPYFTDTYRFNNIFYVYIYIYIFSIFAVPFFQTLLPLGEHFTQTNTLLVRPREFSLYYSDLFCSIQLFQLKVLIKSN